jgi:hypothetical protein
MKFVKIYNPSSLSCVVCKSHEQCSKNCALRNCKQRCYQNLNQTKMLRIKIVLFSHITVHNDYKNAKKQIQKRRNMLSKWMKNCDVMKKV